MLRIVCVEGEPPSKKAKKSGDVLNIINKTKTQICKKLKIHSKEYQTSLESLKYIQWEKRRETMNSCLLLLVKKIIPNPYDTCHSPYYGERSH